MRHHRSFFWLVAGVGALLGLLSCPNPLPDVTEGTGSLLLQLGSLSDSRLIGPDIPMGVALYEVSGSGPGGRSFQAESTGPSLEVNLLAFGPWDLQVRAYNGTDAASRVWIGYGEASAVVHAGSSTTVSIAVTPLPGPGQEFSLQVSWPEEEVGTPIVSGQLVHQSSGATLPLSFSLSPGLATATLSAPPSGYYTLFFQLSEAGQLVVGKAEVVRVVEGRPTHGQWSFSKLNRPTGTIQLEIDPRMQEPLEVSLSVGQEVGVQPGQALGVAASVAGSGQYGYAWYVDGNPVAVGNQDSYVYSAPLQSGYHHLDCTVFSLDGLHGGDAGRLITVGQPVPVAERALWARTTTAGSSGSGFYSLARDSSGNVYAAGDIYGIGELGFGDGVTVGGTSSADNVLLVKYSGEGTAQWARGLTAGTGQSWFLSVAADASGTVYAAGAATGTGPYGFGDGVAVTGTAEGYNLLLVRYDPSGTAQWARTVAVGPDESGFRGVAADSYGNVYAAGAITGTGSFDLGDAVSAAGGSSDRNLVLVKYDAAGTALWARSVAASTGSEYNSVAVDRLGNVYAAGYLSGAGTYDLGNGVTVTGASSSSNLVLVKYTASGEVLWARTAVGASPSVFKSVAASGYGSLYAVGYMSGTGEYGFGNEVTVAGASPDNNLVLVKYDSAGTAQWARSVTTGAESSECDSVAVDSLGNVYSAGYIIGTSAYGFGSGVTATGTFAGANVLLVKYTGSGSALWARTVTAGALASLYMSVAADDLGDVYASGAILRTYPYGFGDGVIVAGTSYDPNAVLVKYGR